MIVVSASALLTFVLQVLAVLGLTWALFGGLLCARAARARELNAWRYAITGAAYSLLFFLPWIYLWSKLRNKPLRLSTITGGYLLIYALWILGPITGFGISGSYGGVASVLARIAWAMVAISLLHMLVAILCIRETGIHNPTRRLVGLNLTIAGLMPLVYMCICLGLDWLFFYTASPLVEY